MVLERAQSLQEMLGVFNREPPPPPRPATGFFTDTSLCIGCKACEVACRQWNQLAAPDPTWTGTSYDNTQMLGAETWRHVRFIEQIGIEQIGIEQVGIEQMDRSDGSNRSEVQMAPICSLPHLPERRYPSSTQTAGS